MIYTYTRSQGVGGGCTEINGSDTTTVGAGGADDVTDTTRGLEDLEPHQKVRKGIGVAGSTRRSKDMGVRTTLRVNRVIESGLWDYDRKERGVGSRGVRSTTQWFQRT